MKRVKCQAKSISGVCRVTSRNQKQQKPNLTRKENATKSVLCFIILMSSFTSSTRSHQQCMALNKTLIFSLHTCAFQEFLIFKIKVHFSLNSILFPSVLWQLRSHFSLPVSCAQKFLIWWCQHKLWPTVEGATKTEHRASRKKKKPHSRTPQNAPAGKRLDVRLGECQARSWARLRVAC